MDLTEEDDAPSTPRARSYGGFAGGVAPRPRSTNPGATSKAGGVAPLPRSENAASSSRAGGVAPLPHDKRRWADVQEDDTSVRVVHGGDKLKKTKQNKMPAASVSGRSSTAAGGGEAPLDKPRLSIQHFVFGSRVHAHK